MGYDNSDHVVFTCPQCKKKFDPRSPSIFCSDKCDKEFQIELNKDIEIHNAKFGTKKYSK